VVFELKLRCQLNLTVGYCAVIDMPAGIKVETPAPANLRSRLTFSVVECFEVVRAVRPPRPYKGQGHPLSPGEGVSKQRSKDRSYFDQKSNTCPPDASGS
jgi:hypothetical protein